MTMKFPLSSSGLIAVDNWQTAALRYCRARDIRFRVDIQAPIGKVVEQGWIELLDLTLVLETLFEQAVKCVEQFHSGFRGLRFGIILFDEKCMICVRQGGAPLDWEAIRKQLKQKNGPLSLFADVMHHYRSSLKIRETDPSVCHYGTDLHFAFGPGVCPEIQIESYRENDVKSAIGETGIEYIAAERAIRKKSNRFRSTGHAQLDSWERRVIQRCNAEHYLFELSCSKEFSTALQERKFSLDYTIQAMNLLVQFAFDACAEDCYPDCKIVATCHYSDLTGTCCPIYAVEFYWGTPQDAFELAQAGTAYATGWMKELTEFARKGKGSLQFYETGLGDVVTHQQVIFIMNGLGTLEIWSFRAKQLKQLSMRSQPKIYEHNPEKFWSEFEKNGRKTRAVSPRRRMR